MPTTLPHGRRVTRPPLHVPVVTGDGFTRRALTTLVEADGHDLLAAARR